jgi:hypothetical protein
MIEEFAKASALPPEWDERCGDNYALKRDFLALLEKANPCNQRYYIFRNRHDAVDSILMTFRVHRCNITMFTPLDFRVTVTFIHLPLSITRPGFLLGPDTKQEVDAFLRTIKGYVIVLNARPGIAFPGFAEAMMCPQVELPLSWESFEAYRASMRSNYRYRINKALQRGKNLSFRFLRDNSEFDERLYGFYEAVHDKSRIGVEKLGMEFFRGAPGSTIIVCELGGTTAGFVQMISNGKELIFAFVGLDYGRNTDHDIYLNLLLYMVRYGIEQGYSVLELGQTAEDAKLRLGGEMSPLHALLHHSNPLFNWIMRRIRKVISYRQPLIRYRIFKDT